MAQNVDQSKMDNESEILKKLKIMKNDLSLNKFTSTRKLEDNKLYSDVQSDDFTAIKKRIEEADVNLKSFVHRSKYNKEE